MMDFSCTTHDVGDQLVVEVCGDVDIATAPRLRSHLLEAHRLGRSRLILDLRQVGFIDSTGLSVLVGAFKRARASGGCVQVVANTNAVMRPLQVTGLHRVFSVCSSVEAAMTP